MLVRAGVHSSTMHYLKAIQAAGTDNSDAVMAKMREVPINDFIANNGKIRTDGPLIHDMYLVEVKRPDESKQPWDYCNIKSVIPASKAFRPLSAITCPLVKKNEHGCGRLNRPVATISSGEESNMKTLTFDIESRGETSPRTVTIGELVVAGWTGRDVEAMEAHIRELEELGVKRPAYTPVFYRVAADRLGSQPQIQVSGEASSGEAEFLLVKDLGDLFIGIASDHTDREVETYGITVSKQMCEKPCSSVLWRFADIRGHWDQLVLRSYATINGERVLYQEGSVTAMRAPEDLLARFADHGGEFDDGYAMLCGTLPAIGGIRPARRFEVELEDPVLGRTLHHSYDVVALPING